jgi:16S rRNA (cytidine1402-2'-O)-methyltransferase
MNPRDQPRLDGLTVMAGLAEQEMPAGALYVVGLPIGNAADITLRAMWVLARVDAVAAEDTRVTAPLLARYGIDTPLVAAHQHNERKIAATIVERLQAGQRIALVTDAGTPGISDPGALIVRAALDAGRRVIPIPGATSAAAAISAAGLREGRFRHIGFLPTVARERERQLRQLAAEPDASVLFEAPHRIRALLASLAGLLAADRRVVVARELTKKFESIAAYPAAALAALAAEERGEYVVIIDAATEATASALDDAARGWLEALLKELPPARAAAVVSQMTGVARAAVYDAALEMQRGGTPRRERASR